MRKELAMPTVSYEVIGKHGAPNNFKKYILKTLSKTGRSGKLPHIVARRIVVDELATRRSQTDTEIEFNLEVHSTYHHSYFSVTGSMCFDGVKEDRWILIEATDYGVRFDVID